MKLPCYLVRDLLPLYKDEVCEPETAADVREHLEGCPDCRTLWETLQTAAPLEEAVNQAKAQEQAAALRRVKHTQQKKRVQTILVTLLVVILLGGGGLGLYFHAVETYLEYPQESILGVEEEPISEQWRIRGKGIVLKLDSTVQTSIQWSQVLNTPKGDVMVFTLGRSQWDVWTRAQWSDDSYEILLYTEAMDGMEAMERLKAVYYLPYSEFESWIDSESRLVPEDAVL
ncbi:MAG TPA: zf-HC2 domain-containing protein, partial [Candidatus Gemmiger excrementavium]|nr:zf-HC2 domain-containing protein [Candidatus Gemmiger excrementavium]